MTVSQHSHTGLCGRKLGKIRRFSKEETARTGRSCTCKSSPISSDCTKKSQPQYHLGSEPTARHCSFSKTCLASSLSRTWRFEWLEESICIHPTKTRATTASEKHILDLEEQLVRAHELYQQDTNAIPTLKHAITIGNAMQMQALHQTIRQRMKTAMPLAIRSILPPANNSFAAFLMAGVS